MKHVPSDGPQKRTFLRLILVAYVAANSILYSMMLPLWEGFDEPFHFGYVQWLANGRGLPDERGSLLSREIAESLSLAPGSRVVQRNLPQIVKYSEYFSLPRDKREAARKALNEIRPELRRQDSEIPNYEVHHAPLAYGVLALPERMLAGAPLPLRVLVLRIVGALLGGLLLYFGADRLFAELGFRGPYRSAAVFCVVSCQMTWATVAHVANDWLAVPLAVWSLAAAIRYWKNPNARNVVWMAGLLSAGLLTKAYFVAVVPAAVALCVSLRRWKELCLALAIIFVTAAPWYARNAYRYGAVTGMVESRAGIGAATVVQTAPSLDWPRAAVASVRSALWTGNNSFTSFSARTLAAVIAVWVIALILWAVSRHTAAEWITSGYCALFVAALGYITVVSHIFTRGAASGPSPWYSQVLVAPTLGLAFLGCSRRPALGRFAASALVALFGYVLIATYVVKLIPLYGGYEGRTSLALLAGLYSKRLPELLDNLGLVALAPAGIILSGVAVVVTLALVQVVGLIGAMFMKAGDGSSRADRWFSTSSS